MQHEAMLTQLGYVSNEALLRQLKQIEENTVGYEKIQKHIMDLHDALKVDGSFVAMSNTRDNFKIKIEALSPKIAEEADEKIQHFSDKFKIKIEKNETKNAYYIIGFDN
ncbi:MAG: hypothetical protein AUK54_01420 [Helicobacteraceae bacterium CG2_30_36_10]|nr:MAG: hypothetical protein AUK54_01420 [Helicobacteraceae bacterium CG2_30_36_10]